MAGEWRSSTWGDEISLEYGKGLRGYDASQGQYRVFGANGPIGWTSQPLAPGPGVILGRKGAYRGVHYSPDPFFVIDTAYYVVPKNASDMRWLYYAIQHYGLGKIDDGSPIPSTTRSAVYVRGIKVPPLPEQRAIAGILGALDDKIELNRRMNRTLEEMARALFKAWFVDFEPVRAKMAGRAPTSCSAEVAALFPSRLVPSELGLIPEGWRVGTLSSLVEIVGGGTPRTAVPEYWDGEIPWFSVVDTPADGDMFVLVTEKSITTRGLEESSTRLLPQKATIISARGTVGNCAIVGRPMAFNQSCYGLLPSDDRGWYYTYFNVRLCVDQLQRSGHGSVFNTITRGTFDGLDLPKPPVDLTRLFDQRIEPFMARALRSTREATVLAELRDTLRPKLMSGQVRVKAEVD